MPAAILASPIPVRQNPVIDSPAVEPFIRCGNPAERPTTAHGHMDGKEADHLPLCVDYLELLLTDAEALWLLLRSRSPGSDG